VAADMSELVTDLAAETEVIEQMLVGLPDDAWDTPTPAEGWLIRDQIAHLAYFDEAAVTSVLEPERFKAEAKAHIAVGMDFPDRLVQEQRSLSVPELHAWFRRARLSLITETGERDPKERVPWYGPSMSLASSVTARIMETWAHGQDIADALGVIREPSMRLRHIAHIGVGARAYSFGVRELEVPEVPIRVELNAPDGSIWSWGPEDAADRVTGDALDFCLLVIQRRHRDETRLEITGPAADAWMSIAQAFAGAAGPGRPAPVA
jgi:uncharacterized protein (TIGR03084 family)